MESYYTISTLHLPDSGREINEDDCVTIKLTSGSVFKGVQVANIKHDSIEVTYTDYIDCEATIPYDEIESIEICAV